MTSLRSLIAASLLLGCATPALAQERSLPSDANGDGMLTIGEARAHAEAQFARLDVNRDGLLSVADRAAARALRRDRRFDLADADDDGALTRDEFAAAGAALDARLAERRQRRMDRLTDDRALESDERPYRARRAARRGGMMAMAAQADLDGDRAITRDEYLAAAELRFRRFDADGDGTITRAERGRRDG